MQTCIVHYALMLYMQIRAGGGGGGADGLGTKAHSRFGEFVETFTELVCTAQEFVRECVPVLCVRCDGIARFHDLTAGYSISIINHEHSSIITTRHCETT